MDKMNLIQAVDVAFLITLKKRLTLEVESLFLSVNIILILFSLK